MFVCVCVCVCVFEQYFFINAYIDILYTFLYKSFWVEALFLGYPAGIG